MKEHKKKILIIVVGILLIIGIGIGVSYAWWTHTVSQEGINTIQSTCLEIALEDENSITLEKAYPITDEEAEKLTPYTFTITNKCPTMIEYDVNLDIMESSSRLSSSYVAIEFNGNEKKLLSTLESVETSYPGVDYVPVEGRYITSGELGANESKTYTIKLWMDESVTVEDDAMNKSFISKVVVTAKQSHKVRLVDYVINKNEAEEFKHEATEQTPALTDYRYTGKNPNNYICFGSEEEPCPEENLYRIIGVMPTQSKVGGEYENRVKLIKVNYNNTSPYSSSSSVNNWEASPIRSQLNNTYFNSLNSYKNFVASSVWYLGAPTHQNLQIYTPKQFYTSERSNTRAYTGGNLNVIDFIGLMYPSDYGYSMGFSYINLSVYTYQNIFKTDSWLYQSSDWTISSDAFGYSVTQTAWRIQLGGFLNDHYVTSSDSCRPTFYLKSNVLYENGDGSQENPYRISNNE